MSSIHGLLVQKVVGELVDHTVVVGLASSGITINNITIEGGAPTVNRVFPAVAMFWTVVHNRGVKPVVDVLDENGEEILADLYHSSDNAFTVSFLTPQKGSVSYT